MFCASQIMHPPTPPPPTPITTKGRGNILFFGKDPVGVSVGVKLLVRSVT